jgi:hypothetical protein
MARAKKLPLPIDALRPLYGAVMQYQAARPWDVIGDDVVFGVEDPVTGTIGWCSVLGAAGQLRGLAVYDGADGLALYRAILRDEASPDETQTAQRGFLIAFGPRRELDPEDISLLAHLDIRPRGRNAWPMVRALTPGYLPVVPDPAGARRLTALVTQVLAVAHSTTDAADELGPDSSGCVLVRRHAQGEDVWRSVRVRPADPPAVLVSNVPDEGRARRTAELPQRAGLRWECDYGYAPIAIEDARGKPGYAAVVLIVDHATGIILEGRVGVPPLDPVFLQDTCLATLEKNQMRPSAVRVRTEATRAALAPLAAAGRFTVERTATLPMLEEARASMIAAMNR